jgi:two-component system, chemotaxis family, chemotaxis protein CheY
MLLPSNTKFLLVDDSPSTVAGLKDILVHEGYSNIFTAHTGKEALEILATRPIEFIICDYTMPEMDGMEFLKTLKKHDKYKYIPFLLITAHSELRVVSSFLREGVDQFVIKPFNSSNVIERINSAWLKHNADS